MSYLGSNEAAFRLGNQAVSVYLGAVEVYRAPLTFTAAVNGNWSNVGNWSGGALPTAEDNVIVTASVLSNSGGTPTVANLTVQSGSMEIGITVTGLATFNGSSVYGGALTGNAVFNDSSSLYFGSVSGTATFNDSACLDTGGTAGTFVPNPPPSCP